MFTLKTLQKEVHTVWHKYEKKYGLKFLEFLCLKRKKNFSCSS